MKNLPKVILILILSFTTNLSCGTTIKMKNGKIVEGEIKGTLVLKNEKQTQKGSTKNYTVMYDIVQGEDIILIDDSGVHVKKDGVFLLFSVLPISPGFSLDEDNEGAFEQLTEEYEDMKKNPVQYTEEYRRAMKEYQKQLEEFKRRKKEDDKLREEGLV